MSSGNKALIRSRLIWKVLVLTGAIELLLASSASWAVNNFPLLIYLLVAIAFTDLGLFAYLLYNVFIHFRATRLKDQSALISSSRVKLTAISLLVSAAVETSYVTLTDSWNEYAVILLIGILFSLLLIPFHYIFADISRSPEE